MIDPWILLAFVPAALALNLTPGADMLFCIGQGLRAGPRAAMAASGGIALGAFVHVTIAGLGLGALVAAAPRLFDVIRWIGVSYLLWLAWGALRAAPRDAGDIPRARHAFRDGLLVNLANPKVILFVLAFVPQFVDPTRAILPQFWIFGAVLALGGYVINGAAGVFADGLGRRLSRAPGVTRALGLASAGIFTALALRLALLERS